MATRIKLVANDNQPALIVALSRHESGAAVDVSTATTRLKFREVGDDTILATLTATKLAGTRLSDGTIDTTDATLGKGGRVSFAWGSTLVDLAAGQYEGEIEITYADTTVETVYEPLKFTVREDF